MVDTLRIASLEAEVSLLRAHLCDFESRLSAIELSRKQETLSKQKPVRSMSNKTGKINRTVNTKTVASRQHTISSISQIPAMTNSRTTLRSQSFMAMRHLINLVDSTKTAQISNNKTTVNHVLQSSKFHHPNKPQTKVLLEATSCTKKPGTTVNLNQTKSQSPTVNTASMQANQDQPQSNHTSSIQLNRDRLQSNPSTIENSSITTKSHRMTSIQKFNMLPKHVRIFNIIKATFRGLCLPSDEELATDYGYRSSNRKVSAEKIQVQSDRLIRKGSAGVWVWNSEMQVGEYYYLRKKSSKSSSKGPISRYSGWATDGSPGHHPPSKEQMPSKLLEKFKDLQGYKWYLFKDRWLLFSLHNA